MREPSWSTSPSDAVKGVNYQLIRSSKKHGLELTLVVLSDQLFGHDMHWRARQYPCLVPEGYECEFCQRGSLPRWYGYLGCWWEKDRRCVVVEVTSAAEPAIKAYHDSRGSLRGAELKLRRVDGKQTGLLIASLRPADFRGELPPDINVSDCLSRLWGFNLRLSEATPLPEADPILQTDPRFRIMAGLDQHEPAGIGEALAPIGPRINGHSRKAVGR